MGRRPSRVGLIGVMLAAGLVTAGCGKDEPSSRPTDPATDFTSEGGIELKVVSPRKGATVSNPLDYNTSLWGHEDLLVKCFSTVMRGEFDAGMLVIDFATDGPETEAACLASVRALVKACAAHGKMPIVTSTLSELLPVHARGTAIIGCQR